MCNAVAIRANSHEKQADQAKSKDREKKNTRHEPKKKLTNMNDERNPGDFDGGSTKIADAAKIRSCFMLLRDG